MKVKGVLLRSGWQGDGRIVSRSAVQRLAHDIKRELDHLPNGEVQVIGDVEVSDDLLRPSVLKPKLKRKQAPKETDKKKETNRKKTANAKKGNTGTGSKRSQNKKKKAKKGGQTRKGGQSSQTRKKKKAKASVKVRN